MKTTNIISSATIALLLLTALIQQPTTASGQTTSFTYQGRLKTNGVAATGAFDFQFALFADASSSNQVDTTMSAFSVGVTNGLFTVELVFPVAGADFNGNDRWLQTYVRPSFSGTNFSTILPRERITSTPYAIRALMASQADSLPHISDNLTNGSLALGLFTVASGNNSTAMGIQTTASGPTSTAMGQTTTASGGSSTAMGEQTVASGNFATAMGYGTHADGTHSTALGWGSEAKGNFSIASGYASKTAGERTFAAGTLAYATNEGSFVWSDASLGTGLNAAFGSTSSNQFLIRATGGVGINTNNPNGTALAVNGDMTVTGNFKGGYPGNIISNGVVGAFIGSGGNSNFPNIVGADYATVVGGVSNRALGLYSTAMGGGSTASGQYSTAAGNSTAGGPYSVAMGYHCSASHQYSVALGSLATASSNYSIAIGALTTASGFNSTAIGTTTTASGTYSFAGGVLGEASGPRSITLGNNCTASGFVSIAMGDNSISSADYAMAIGYSTRASGPGSMALGVFSQAMHQNSFVWSDGTTNNFGSSSANQFLIRATGGVGINTDNPNGAALAVNGDTTLVGNVTVSGIVRATNNATEGFEVSGTAAGYALRDRANGSRWSIYANNNLLGFYLNGDRMTLGTNGLTVNGTFVSASDRNLKENFKPVNAQAVLDKVTALPLSEWNYKEDTASRHLGPMAQDFYAAFNVGPDDKHITTIDESGVALAAIQGLNQKLERKLEQKESEITELKTRLEKLERLFGQK